MYSLTCVKCKQQYQGEEPEAFYCSPCDAERKRIAANIDAQFQPRGEIKSEFQMFEEKAKTHKTPDGRTVQLMNVKHLM